MEQWQQHVVSVQSSSVSVHEVVTRLFSALFADPHNKANSMVNSHCQNSLWRSLVVRSPLLEVMGCLVRSSRLHFLVG